jgi:ferredoxin
MADSNSVWEDNVAGAWYVDKNCILCGLCKDVAPANFKDADSGDHAVICKQPDSEEEKAACQDAMEQCPVESIGNDR